MIRKKLHPKGYQCECVNGVDDLVHRRVWREAHGEIPKGYHIHHINGDKCDNRLENLGCKQGRRHTIEHHGVYVSGGVDMKACKACGTAYTVEALGIRKNGRIKSYCRKCEAAQSRAYRERVKGAPLRAYRVQEQACLT